jgi:hypothetical protein
MPCGLCSRFFSATNANAKHDFSFYISGSEGWQSLCLEAGGCSECSLLEKIVRAGAPEGPLDVQVIRPVEPGPFLGLAVLYGASQGAFLESATSGFQSHLFPFTAAGGPHTPTYNFQSLFWV